MKGVSYKKEVVPEIQRDVSRYVMVVCGMAVTLWLLDTAFQNGQSSDGRRYHSMTDRQYGCPPSSYCVSHEEVMSYQSYIGHYALQQLLFFSCSPAWMLEFHSTPSAG